MNKADYNRSPHSKIIKKIKSLKQFAPFLLFIIIFDYLLFPLPILAKEAQSTDLVDIAGNVVFYSNTSHNSNYLPLNKDRKIAKISLNTVTAYNSAINQTDDSPCITANGFNVCQHGVEDTAAANFLPFGTKIKIPELFGERVFVVRDRMNRRHNDKIDIWMKSHDDAIKFGKQLAQIQILE